MGTKARVIVLPEQDRPLYVDEVELPAPGPHQVLIRQFASGICHTQLLQMQAPRSGPVVLGHESTGVVLDVGSLVQDVEAGQLVMVTWIRCRPVGGRSIPPSEVMLSDGTIATSLSVYTWADHIVTDESFVVPLPGDAPTDVTSVIGCAVMTGAGAVIRTADVRPGESVAVFGVGGVGLAAVGAASIAGADPIIAIDLDRSKLELAARFGATHLVDATTVDVVEAVRDVTRRSGEATRTLGQATGGVDYAFDCVAVRRTMEQAFAAVRSGVFGVSRGGTAVLIGIPQENFELDAGDLLRGEKTYRGSVAGSCVPDRDFPVFLAWHQQKKLDLNALVTRRYGVSQINEATTELAEGRILGRAILEFDH